MKYPLAPNSTDADICGHIKTTERQPCITQPSENVVIPSCKQIVVLYLSNFNANLTELVVNFGTICEIV